MAPRRDRLGSYLRSVRDAVDHLADARAGVDEAVADALDAGISLRTVAAEVDMSHEGIRKAAARHRRRLR